MKQTRIGSGLAVLAGILLAGQAAKAQSAAYTITDIGDLGGGGSRGYGLNNKGEVVGQSNTADGRLRPFLYSNGTIQDLGNFVGDNIPANNDVGAANGINDSGQVVGFAADSNDDFPFLYSNGMLHNLGSLGFPNAINNSGQFTGGEGLYYSNGTASTMPAPAGGYSTDGFGINNLGQVAGSYVLNGGGTSAFLYRNGQSTDIGKDTGLYLTEAHGINDSGVIAGVGTLLSNGEGERAFLWQNGNVKILGTLGGDNSFAQAINNAGVVVGEASVMRGYFEPFVYQNGVMSDIFAGTGWIDGNATGINDLGQIAGYGYSPDGQMHAFLATPVVVPAPGSLLVAVLGGGLLMARLRRRKF